MVCLTTVSDSCIIIAIFYKYQSCVFLWQFVGFLKLYIGIWKKIYFGTSSCGVIIWYAFIIISCSLSLCDVHLALVYVHLAFCDDFSSLCNHNLSLLHAYMIRIYHYGMCFFNHVMWFRLYIMSCWTSICNMVSLYSICFFFGDLQILVSG